VKSQEFWQPLNTHVSWLRIQFLHSFFKIICEFENAQKIVCRGSGLSVVCGCESAQKGIGEGSSERRLVMAKAPRRRSVAVVELEQKSSQGVGGLSLNEISLLKPGWSCARSGACAKPLAPCPPVPAAMRASGSPHTPDRLH